jgi:hypothetical protein
LVDVVGKVDKVMRVKRAADKKMMMNRSVCGHAHVATM